MLLKKYVVEKNGYIDFFFQMANFCQFTERGGGGA
jgi:hypothetical protein